MRALLICGRAWPMRSQVSLNTTVLPLFSSSQDVPAACRDRHHYPRPRPTHRHHRMGETAVALAHFLIYGEPSLFVFIPPRFLTINLFACTPFSPFETVLPTTL